MPFVSLLCYLFIFLYFALIFPTSWQPSITSMSFSEVIISWQDDLSYLNYIHWTYSSFFCFSSNQVSSTIRVEYHEPNEMISSPRQLLFVTRLYYLQPTWLRTHLWSVAFISFLSGHMSQSSSSRVFQPHSRSVEPPVWLAPWLAFGIDIGFLSCQVSQFEASNVC